MKTLVIKADDAIVERIVSLFELFPKNQYEMKIVPGTPAETGTETGATISLKRGSAKNIVTYIADDFDEPLDDFKEYMS